MGRAVGAYMNGVGEDSNAPSETKEGGIPWFWIGVGAAVVIVLVTWKR